MDLLDSDIRWWIILHKYFFYEVDKGEFIFAVSPFAKSMYIIFSIIVALHQCSFLTQMFPHFFDFTNPF